ncbi:MAG: SGNH/GDSL hydrolase family protein [Opitutaceae bacterium]
MKNQSVSICTRRFLAAMVLAVVTFQSAYAGNSFSKIVVFGDSINDRGNMTALTGGVFPAPPTYAYGRQSNGPVWVEYLAAQLKLQDRVVDYAVVGALTKPAPGFPTGNVWSDTFPGLDGTDVFSQVLAHLSENGSADPAALYILEGGANDFPRVQNPAAIVNNLLEMLVGLQARGARHIVLVNLPDIGKTPRVILGERFGFLAPGTAAFVSGACAQLNQALEALLPAYTYPGVKITIADTFGFINRAAAQPALFGLVDVQAPFLLTGNGGDPSQWLFWDDLHPTTRGHEIFAETVAESLLLTYSPGKAGGKGALNSLHGLVGAPGR